MTEKNNAEGEEDAEELLRFIVPLAFMSLAGGFLVIGWQHKPPTYPGWRRKIASLGLVAAGFSILTVPVYVGLIRNLKRGTLRYEFALIAVALGSVSALLAMTCGLMGKGTERYAYVSGLLMLVFWFSVSLASIPA